jgi:DNA-binding GntR family transcriptional regulator
VSSVDEIVDNPNTRSIASDQAVEGEWRVVGSGRLVAESALRAAIADGDLLPGARLVEADLVAMLGVSRGNIRLAIDALAAEGLVERIQNKGARVRVVSTEEAIAITECRMPLEGLLARKAAERVTDAETDQLRGHLHTMAAAVDSGDVLKYSELIQQLHGMVGEAARHPIAADLVGRLQAQLVRHQFQLSLRPGRPQVSLRELTALVEAIADRDPDRAEAAAVSHFRSVIAALSEPTPGRPT